MKIKKLKTIGFSIAVFLLPFLFMVIVNETIAIKKKEKAIELTRLKQ